MQKLITAIIKPFKLYEVVRCCECAPVNPGRTRFDQVLAEVKARQDFKPI
jgi:hypothetical protein